MLYVLYDGTEETVSDKPIDFVGGFAKLRPGASARYGFDLLTVGTCYQLVEMPCARTDFRSTQQAPLSADVRMESEMIDHG